MALTVKITELQKQNCKLFCALKSQVSYHLLTQTLIQVLEKPENFISRGSIQRFLFIKIYEDWLNFCLNMC